MLWVFSTQLLLQSVPDPSSRASVFYRICHFHPHERRRCNPCRSRSRLFTGFIRSVVVDHRSIGDSLCLMGPVAHDLKISEARPLEHPAEP